MTNLSLASFAPKSLDDALVLVLESAKSEQTFADAARGALKAAIAFVNVPQCGKNETVSKEDELRLSPIFDEYLTGRLMGGCALEESAARVQLSLQPYFFAAPAKNSDKNRTERAQRVLNSARVTLSRIRAAFNIPAMKTARAPRPEGNDKAGKGGEVALAHGSSAPTSASALEVPHVSNRANGLDWLRDIDKKLATFSGTNAAHLPLSIKEAIVALHKAIEAECDPKAAQIEALQAQLAKLMNA